MPSSLLHLGRAQHEGAGHSGATLVVTELPELSGGHSAQAHLAHIANRPSWTTWRPLSTEIVEMLPDWSAIKGPSDTTQRCGELASCGINLDQGNREIMISKADICLSFYLFCGVLSCRVYLKSFWEVVLTEGMNMPLQDEHRLAAHLKEWPQSNVCITLVDICLSPPLLFFFTLTLLGLHFQHEVPAL